MTFGDIVSKYILIKDSLKSDNPFGDRSNPFGDRSNPFGDRSNPVGDRSNPFGDRSNPVGDWLKWIIQRYLFSFKT